MEHKLIEGGEKYLALARSEIKRLRATGLPYATKRLVFPDATVRVQIIDDIDFIHITGGGAKIPMDSGVVAVVSIGEANPATKEPGTLYETTYVQDYNTPFVLPNAEATVRLNPSPGNDGQFSGILKITGQKFKGKVPIDVSFAKSFDAPTGEALAVWGDAIADKKNTAVLCPASMFTGKCRLYVQALYGAHMVAGKPTPYRLSGASGAPSLYVDNRTSDGDAVLVSTGCGVYLDKKRGNHWLFSTNGTPVRGWPLKAPSAVEALRKHLITEVSETNTKLSTLNEEDQEHLETYILSQCLPKGDGRSAFLKPDTTDTWYGASNPYSMGYSWHWNWDGKKADAVTNGTIDQVANNAAMQSLWHKATITQIGAESFEWSEVDVDPGVLQTWTVYRTQWTIAEPDWGSYYLIKTTPQSSLVSACDATFYVFYNRNELVKCSVQVRDHEGEAAIVTYGNGANGGPDGTNCYTTGNKPGSRRSAGGSSAYSYAVFSCGAKQTPILSTTKTTAVVNIEVKDKVFGNFAIGYGSGALGYREFGVSEDDGTNYHVQGSNSYLVDDRMCKIMTFTTVDTGTTEREYGIATVVVPFYDAEAIYLQASTEKTTTTDSNTTRYLYNDFSPLGAFLIQSIVSETGGDDRIFFRQAQEWGAYQADNHGQASPNETIIPDPVIEWSGSESLICHAGILDATFENMGVFHSNGESTIPSAFYTLSGTKNDEDAAVISNNLVANPYGAPGVAVPVLVGWV